MYKDIPQKLNKFLNTILKTYDKKAKIISVQFPINTLYNTPYKRLKFIRKMDAEPIKRQHKTPNFYKYRIDKSNKKKRHYTKKINNVNVIFEY